MSAALNEENDNVVWRVKIAYEMIEPGSAVLDVGCGDGTLCKLLMKNKKCETVGIDISKDAIAKARAKGVDAILMDVEKLPLPFDDSSFDYVVALDVLEHLREPKKVLRELVRVTRKYGIFSYGNTAWWRNRIELLLGKVPKHAPFKCGQHLQYWNFFDFKKLIETSGFKLVYYEVLGGVPLLGRILPVGVASKIVRMRPNLFGFGFVWKAEKNQQDN